MNYYTQTIVDFTFYTSLVRDTLAYILYHDKDLVPLYNDQKHSLKIELEVNSPINKVFENNGENGKNIRNGLFAFYDFLFNKEKYVSIVDGKVSAKHELDVKVTHDVIQHLLVLLPMIDQHIDAYQQKGLLEKEAKSLSVNMKRYTLACSYLALYILIEKNYFDFNNLKNKGENNDSESIKERISNINLLIEMYGYLIKQIPTDDERLKDCIESFNEVLQVIVGKKKLESNSQIPQYTMEIRKKLIDTTKEFSISFMEIYGPLMKELYLIQQEVMKKAQTK